MSRSWLQKLNIYYNLPLLFAVCWALPAAAETNMLRQILAPDTPRLSAGGIGAAILMLLPSALVLGWWFTRRYVQPLMALSRALQRSTGGTYDEVLDLRSSGNHAAGALVRRIQMVLRQAAERNRELTLQIEVKDRALVELAEANQRLVALSRQAGMAEVATNVLHNVNNVLNSLNVSATIVAGKLRESRVNKLTALADMLIDHSGEWDRFLRDDPKGQRVLPYLSNLGRHFEQERESMLTELEQLTKHVGHIKEIVSTQQSYARVAGVTERFALDDMVEDAIRILGDGLNRDGIELIRDFEEVPALQSNKHQVLQIVLNLLRNARQAIDEAGGGERRIHIWIRMHGADRVRLDVRDSGAGLTARNLTRIFTHGFTTRSQGHGFGLHSAAVSARQLGGGLWAESEGPGCGAVFTLELPLKPLKVKEEGSSDESAIRQ